MFERYTERARRVIFFARYEAEPAGQRGHRDRAPAARADPRGQRPHLAPLQQEPPVDGADPPRRGRALALRGKVSTSVEIPLSLESKRVLGHAAEEAERMLHNYIGTEHILLGLMREERSVAAGILTEKGMRLAGTREDILALLNEKAAAGKSKETPLLSEFSRDLTEAAARGALDPLVGREEELERVIQVLCRRTRNNPVLIGEPGVGKTALVEGLATKIVHGDVPVYLAEKRVLALDISLIVAGTKYRGQFEERLKTIMRELTETPNIVIFIDELHTLVGAGSAEGSLDAANILKPALSRGEIQCIGATTPSEYRKHIEKDRALERRFQAVKVASPTELETVEILRGVKERYEKFHNVLYLDEAIEAAVYQSSRYITDRFLPDKAIDLIDEAGSRVKLRETGAPALVPELSGRVRVVLEADVSERGGFFREDESQGGGEHVHVLSSSGRSAAKAATRSARPTSTRWSRAGPGSRSRR
jgi:ATP-dependent Clp protease ATP-binding subunit ClpC